MDPDTFVTWLYVVIDDLCKRLPPPARHPGRQPSLARSEVVTLALFAQWAQFPSERAFYRYAQHHLLPFFPTLPDRTQLNRLIRAHEPLLVHVALDLAEHLLPEPPVYEILDCTAAPVRNSQRRGRSWLAGAAAIGKSGRLGWFFGFKLLACCTPEGVVTGYAMAAGNTNDRPMTEQFLAYRTLPAPPRPSVGWTRTCHYLADTGFWGPQWQQRWHTDYHARVWTPPEERNGVHWPPAWRHWLLRHRQIIESVFGRWLRVFRLEQDRPHTLSGLCAHLAAIVALHNCCILANRSLGRPDLAFADLIHW